MNILIDSLNCNPTAGSNAESGYGFVAQALVRHQVSLFTHRDLFRAGRNELAENPPGNLRVEEITPGLCSKFGKQTDYLMQVLPRARRFVARNPVDIVHTVEPNQYRLLRPLAFLKKPFVLGPLNGGDAYPPASFLSELGGVRDGSFGSGFKRRPWKQSVAHAVNHQIVHGVIASLGTRYVFKKAHRIVIGTDNCLANIPPCHHSKCRRVPCFGIDTTVFSPDHREADNRSVLYVGRITPFKGLDLLLHAFAKCSNKAIVLDIVGSSAGNAEDERFEEYCRRLAEELGIGGRVRFHGQVARNDLVSFYRRAGVFCLPSLWEPMGMVYLEAMACGVPVVGLCAGGPAEIIRDEFGVLAQPRTLSSCIQDIARSLDGLMGNEQRRREMGLSARAEIEQRYTWERVGKKMNEVYEEIR